MRSRRSVASIPGPCARWSRPSPSTRPGRTRGPIVSDAIHYTTIRELGARYRRRDVSPVEVTRELLSRIEKLDPTLHAFVTLTPERAIADARAAEEALKKNDARPLLGIPIGHKDIYLTRGIRTTGGSALFADWVPENES